MLLLVLLLLVLQLQLLCYVDGVVDAIATYLGISIYSKGESSANYTLLAALRISCLVLFLLQLVAPVLT